jgi:hypothetical protein
MGSLPSSMWRLLRYCRAGIITLIAMVLSSLMYRCLCSPGIFAIIAIMLLPLLQCCCCHHQAGVVILVTMASSPLSLCRHLCHCHDGVIALNIARALSPFLHWHHCCYPTDLFALTLHGHCHRCCANVVTPIELACLRR